jgi:hypothetical protein
MYIITEGIPIGRYEEGKRQVDSLFHHFGLETNRPNLTLTLASSVLTGGWVMTQ